MRTDVVQTTGAPEVDTCTLLAHSTLRWTSGEIAAPCSHECQPCPAIFRHLTETARLHLPELSAETSPFPTVPGLANESSEVEVGVPDAAGRAEILRVLLRRVPHAMDDVSTSGEAQVGVNTIAARTHGFVGADLQLLVKEAALQALRRTRGGWGMFSDNSDDVKETGIAINSSVGVVVASGGVGAEGSLPTLTPGDFQAALPLVAPSGLREVAVEVPSVRWADIGGMEGVKQSLREVVEWPLRHPEAFKRMGMSPPRGVLLYGPPGCSKTLMARALATESGMNFLAVKGENYQYIKSMKSRRSMSKLMAFSWRLFRSRAPHARHGFCTRCVSVTPSQMV